MYLILSGLAVMIVGLSRPMMQGIEPTPLDQVILVIDSSASMRASDVLPSRIDLAKQIANAFIEALPAHASLGLISMAANASVIQTPTRQRHQLEQALERISLQPGSALGSAIILATAQAIPEAAIDVERLITGSSRRSMVSSSSLSNASEAGSGSKEAFKQPESPASPGSRESSVIVLLADGDSNMGPAPLEMAEVARLWGLRIYSIGIGTLASLVFWLTFLVPPLGGFASLWLLALIPASVYCSYRDVFSPVNDVSAQWRRVD